MNAPLNSDALIASLADDLSPVRTLATSTGVSIALGTTVAAAVATTTPLGVRGDLLLGDPHPMFFLRGGMLLMLGIATAFAAVRMNRPSVGTINQGWLWAVVAALLFPLAAGISAITHGGMPMEMIVPRYGVECLGYSTLFGLGIGSALTLWLRRGAPTSPERAGLLIGIAAGSLGAFAYSLYCPFNSIYYVGLWYTLAVVISAGVGRFVVPHLIRW